MDVNLALVAKEICCTASNCDGNSGYGGNASHCPRPSHKVMLTVHPKVDHGVARLEIEVPKSLFSSSKGRPSQWIVQRIFYHPEFVTHEEDSIPVML